MKVLYMDEGGDMTEYIRSNAETLGSKVDLVRGQWIEPGTDLGAIIRKVETEGPDDFDAPRGFTENPDAEIVLACFTPFSAKTMGVLKECRVIGAIRGGLENYDIEAATAQGKLVINAGGHNSYSVSEYTVGMILAEMRSIARSHAATLAGTRANYPEQFELHGKTVGLFGFGFIGQLVTKELSGFDVNIITYDPYINAEKAAEAGATVVEKDELFRQADVVCMHARLLPSTYHIVGEHEISLMKPTAYFINTARAGLVDTDALLKALQEKRIAGAALDVFDEEPLPADSPFIQLDNVTLTPHRAGGTLDASIASPRIVVDRIKALLDGEEVTGVVNPEVMENPEFKAWLADAAERIGR